MKFCPECGAKLLNEKAKFCHECGENLSIFGEPRNQAVSETPEKKINDTPKSAPAENPKSAPIVNPESKADSYKKEPENNDSDISEPTVAVMYDVGEDTVSKYDTQVNGSLKSVTHYTLNSNEDDGNDEDTDDDIEDLGEVIPSEDAIPRYKITTTYTERDFLRGAWIQMARDNVPEDVFECDFGKVEISDAEVYERILEACINYEASIGYDRQEPYIAYETYYEDEPYITTESYYNTNTGRTETRQVTKHKKVQKQRQATKYKTVTDWSPFSSSATASSTTSVSNTKAYINERCFNESMLGVDKNHIESSLSGVASSEARKETIRRNYSDFYDCASEKLPGDHAKDLRVDVKEVIDLTEAVFAVKEYNVTLEYKNKKYTKSGYPFGKMTFWGDTVENELDPDTVAEKMLREASAANSIDEENKEKEKFRKSMWYYIPSMALILISAVLSCFLRYPIPLITVFAFAVASFVLCRIMFKRNEKIIDEKVSRRISERNKQTESDIENYTQNYTKKMRELLNKKLESLGLEPVSDEEF